MENFDHFFRLWLDANSSLAQRLGNSINSVLCSVVSNFTSNFALLHWNLDGEEHSSLTLLATSASAKFSLNSVTATDVKHVIAGLSNLSSSCYDGIIAPLGKNIFTCNCRHTSIHF